MNEWFGGVKSPLRSPRGVSVMTTKPSNTDRHDRGPTRRLINVIPRVASLLPPTSGLPGWFWTLCLAGRRPGFHESAIRFLGARRLQPVLVIAATSQSAAPRLTSRGHFNRI
jgi:hypothetical protein